MHANQPARTRRRGGLCALAVIAVLSVLSAMPSAAATDARPLRATAQFSWAKQASLDAIANALGQQGQREFADTYSNLYVDVPNGRVILYATRKSRAGLLVQAAKRAHPGIDIRRVVIVPAAYTMRAIDAGIEKIMKGAFAQQNIYSAGEAPNGSGIQLTVKPGMVSQVMSRLSRATTMSLTAVAGEQIHAATWRWNDTEPFIGGDVLVGPDVKPGFRAQCTSGMMVQSWPAGPQDEDYVMTAAHCYPRNAIVYGEGDPIGDFGFNYGHRFGKVVAINDSLDTELIDTGNELSFGNNSDEADQPQGKSYPVPEFSSTDNGDLVCQDGAHSYYTGHGVPCGLKVVNDNITYQEKWDNGTIHTVTGEEVTAKYAVTAGDSGALVFDLCGGTCRSAVGMVSAESGVGPSSGTMFFVSAPKVLGSYNVILNPAT